MGQEWVLSFGDEYENLDEDCADPSKLIVKRATKACNGLIMENSELFRLAQTTNEMMMEMDEAHLFYNDLHYKLKEMSRLIKVVEENPGQLQRMKKTAILANLQQIDMMSECQDEWEDEAGYLDSKYRTNSSPYIDQEELFVQPVKNSTNKFS